LTIAIMRGAMLPNQSPTSTGVVFSARIAFLDLHRLLEFNSPSESCEQQRSFRTSSSTKAFVDPFCNCDWGSAASTEVEAR
jgi:hypothetical protein